MCLGAGHLGGWRATMYRRQCLLRASPGASARTCAPGKSRSPAASASPIHPSPTWNYWRAESETRFARPVRSALCPPATAWEGMKAPRRLRPRSTFRSRSAAWSAARSTRAWSAEAVLASRRAERLPPGKAVAKPISTAIASTSPTLVPRVEASYPGVQAALGMCEFAPLPRG